MFTIPYMICECKSNAKDVESLTSCLYRCTDILDTLVDVTITSSIKLAYANHDGDTYYFYTGQQNGRAYCELNLGRTSLPEYHFRAGKNHDYVDSLSLIEGAKELFHIITILEDRFNLKVISLFCNVNYSSSDYYDIAILYNNSILFLEYKIDKHFEYLTQLYPREHLDLKRIYDINDKWHLIRTQRDSDLFYQYRYMRPRKKKND